MSVVEQLRQLQALDSQIDAARERIATVEATLADRSEYEASRRQYDELSAALRAVETSQRDLELQLGKARAQQAEVEGKLYSGKVGSPRELDDLQRKANELRRQIEAFEEGLLALMEQAEQAGADARAAEAHLREVVARRRALEAELLAERKRLVADVRAWQAEREQVRAGIEPSALRTYDRLRSTREGLAVAEVRQQTCQGCRVTLTGAQEHRVRHGDTLVTCQSCGRILYAAS